MIKVTIGTTLERETVIVDPGKTLRSAIEEAGIDYTSGTMQLDGAALRPGDLDRTFASFDITDKCFLLNVVKADNGTA